MMTASVQSKKSVQVQAPSRLHFGLINCGNSRRSERADTPADSRMYGGIGAMIDAPTVNVEISSSSELQITGDHAIRVHDWTYDWFRSYSGKLAVDSPSELPCRIHIRSPREHIGLGTGTQLALSLGTALNAFFGMDYHSVTTLAECFCRGRRSAIGIHGFQNGGFIHDSGKVSGQASDCRTGKLENRIEMPEEWRVLLLTERGTSGLAGESERSAFSNQILDDTSREQSLQDLIHESVLPALADKDFETFCQSLGEYGESSGMYFASVQGGPYNGETATNLVSFARNCGLYGAGQTSWGPSIYVICRSESEATNFAKQVADRFPAVDITLASFDNQGAVVSTLAPVE